jgi:hypothetical protein
MNRRSIQFDVFVVSLPRGGSGTPKLFGDPLPRGSGVAGASDTRPFGTVDNPAEAARCVQRGGGSAGRVRVGSFW